MTTSQVKAVPHAYVVLCGTVLLLAAGLFIYSQTYSFADDEGFHLLAAQLIDRGKRPYLDFFFPQTPLNAYWNAAWMGMLGESWRVTHGVATFVVAGSTFLAADYVYRRFPDRAWRLAAATTAALCFGLNELIVVFGTVAQAYGLCLLLIVCAFRCDVEAVRRKSLLWAACAGASASGAVAASLLTAPVAPVLLAWLMWHTHPRGRRSTFLVFCAGALVPLSPLLWLFAEGPRQVFFDIIEYHGLFRQVGWPGAPEHNVEVYSAWIDSGQALVLGGLAAAALLSALKSERFREWRNELVLCAALAAAQGAYLCTIIPTHQRYFLLVVPFLAVLAPAGLYVLVDAPGKRQAAAFAVCAFFALATAKSLFDGRDDYVWSDAESLAAKIDEVTPRDGRIFAEESIYFLTRRMPPRGLEHSDALKLSLPDSMKELLHLTSKDELATGIRQGQFATVEICDEDEKAEFKLDELFAETREFDDCSVYWRFAPKHASDTLPPVK